MNIQKEKRDVFIVNGKEFLSEAEARKYVEETGEFFSYSYYRVQHSPDLTEGRGYFKEMLVAVKKGYNVNVLLHFLVEKLGEPLAMVMGVSPMDNWVIGKEHRFTDLNELTTFLNQKTRDSHKEKLTFYVLDENGRESDSSTFKSLFK